MPKTGGNWTVIATSNGLPFWFFLDGTSVYWLEQDAPNGGSVRLARVGKDGSGQKLIAQDTSNYIAGVTLDPTHVYWLTSVGCHSFSAALDGSGAAPIYQSSPSALFASGFAMDPTHLFWTDQYKLWRVGIDGRAVTALASPGRPYPLGGAWGALVDGVSVYWTEAASGVGDPLLVHKTATDGSTDQVILTKPSAYTGRSFSGTAEFVVDLAVDSTALFFATSLKGGPGLLYKFCK
jgi:hypothetical protein